MVRPRWILALIGALAVAAAFALLGQWQLARAMDANAPVDRTTEIVQPLAEAAQPAEPIRQSSTGQMVAVEGRWVAGDEQLLMGRLNGGVTGYWVVSRFTVETDGEPAIPVARGWAPTEEEARAAAKKLASLDSSGELVTVEGRLLPTEGAEIPSEDGDPHAMKTMAVSALINLWSDFDNRDVYSAYIISHDPPAGLAQIDSGEPEPEVELNWLNIFYAVEWAVFAGFAVFLWYRLVRDTWEREREEAEEAADAAAAASGTAPDEHAALSKRA